MALDIKFFIKVILFMLFVLLFLQYRSARCVKKLMKTVERLNKQQEKLDGLDRRLTDVVEQLDVVKKHNTLVLKQLEQVAYWSAKKTSESNRQTDVLGNNLSKLVDSLGDMHMNVAALGAERQPVRRTAKTSKPDNRTVEELAKLVDEMVTVTAGLEHHEAMMKRETAPASATDTAHELDFVCPPSTVTVDEYEYGTDWESVAIRIDQYSRA
ncbi:hypothetical protein N0V83_003085 [Neocucurbitaria cava]|uniref:Uncharacterized protein n=1 Tax=Neocucurbitaria cava TaxID=798079 RepID=A0A9W9CQ94_9PLEO|nr:hypothetical protein N0V83_003085 [Neocucurbitaria cava]